MGGGVKVGGFQAARTRETGADSPAPALSYTSIPTLRMSARALLFVTTPGRMR